MSTIEVPVKLIIEGENIEAALADIISRDGSLKVVLCQICFALVPESKMDDHIRAAIHGPRT